MEVHVKIDAFEGPLDLLLHLIGRLEIDIYDISVSQITDQYLNFIHQMQKLQLDVAGEYLLMAATLLQMKSKMLLPAQEEDGSDQLYEMPPDEEDPKNELIRRLIEYRKYKEIAEVFRQREERWQLSFSKPSVPLGGRTTRPLVDLSVYDMLSALQKIIQRKRLTTPRKTRIRREEISIQEKMAEILEGLEEHPGNHPFSGLFDNPSDRREIVMAFLAVLELIKDGKVKCRQEGNFKSLMIYKTEGDAHATPLSH